MRERANLKGVRNLTLDQLAKVKKLNEASLDEDLLQKAQATYPYLFELPKRELKAEKSQDNFLPS